MTTASNFLKAACMTACFTASMSLCAGAFAQASPGELSFSLRAADEPAADKKQWDQGAGLAYLVTNGESTVQSDASAKLGYTWLRAGTPRPGQEPLEASSTAFELKAGPSGTNSLAAKCRSAIAVSRSACPRTSYRAALRTAP